MAEGGDAGNEFSFYYDSSEEIRTIHCDPCRFEEETEEAEGFCINCDEYLCNACLQSHQKFRAFRTHNLLYGDSMPKRRSEIRENTCTLFSYCEAHPTNEVKHFCNNHQSVYCRICHTTKHSTCESQEISQVSNIERDRSKLHTTVTKIENLQKSFENIKESDGTTIDQLQARSQTSNAKVKQLQKKMNEIFRNLLDEIKREEKKTEAHIKDLREIFAVSTDAVNHISSFRRSIHQIEQSNEPTVVFAALVKSMNVSSDYTEVKTTIEQKYLPSESSYISTGIKQVMGMCEEVVKLFEQLKSKEQTVLKSKEQTVLKSKEETELKSKEQTELKSKEQTVLKSKDQTVLKSKEQTELKSKEQTELKSKEETELKWKEAEELPIVQPFLPESTQNTPEKQHWNEERVQTQQANSKKTCAHNKENSDTEEHVKASYRDIAVQKPVENRSTTPERKADTLTQEPGIERETKASSTTENNRKLLSDLVVLGKSKKILQTNDSGVKCDITGCLFLPNGWLILCDHENSNLILMDNTFNVTDKLYLKGNAWDVASSGKHEVVVSLVRAKRLEFVQIHSGKLYCVKRMDLKRVCWGVASDGENLYLACHNNPGDGMIEIRRKSGNILKQITLTDQGIELLMPYYISLDQSNSCMYISDAKRNSIICFTIKGKFIGKIQKDNLKWPRALIVDENKTLAICSSFSNSVMLLQQLTTGQWQSKRLLQIERPQAVSIRWKDKTMVIATNQSNTITVLKCT